jgi:hypothetical protein
VRILTNPSFGFCVKAKFEALDHHRRRACLLVALAFLEASSLVVEAGDRREGGREGRGGGGWIRCCCCWSGAESKIQIGERTLGRSVAPRGACSKKLVRNPKGAFSEACFSFYKRKDFPGVQGQRIREKTVSLWNMVDSEFFTEYGEGNRYQIQEVIGKGSYGVVGSAIDTHTGEKVAIKKINDIFEHVSDATRILREIKLLRLLRHPDIVEVKHIMLPPSRREFKDIYVVFELMESDLHQVIKANDDLTPEHYQFFLYQLLRALKYIHTGFVPTGNPSGTEVFKKACVGGWWVLVT